MHAIELINRKGFVETRLSSGVSGPVLMEFKDRYPELYRDFKKSGEARTRHEFTEIRRKGRLTVVKMSELTEDELLKL